MVRPLSSLYEQQLTKRPQTEHPVEAGRKVTIHKERGVVLFCNGGVVDELHVRGDH
jgi:hypothetical protein